MLNWVETAMLHRYKLFQKQSRGVVFHHSFVLIQVLSMAACVDRWKLETRNSTFLPICQCLSITQCTIICAHVFFPHQLKFLPNHAQPV